LARERAFVGYGLTVGLAYAAMFAYIAGSPFVIEERYGLAPQLFSLIFATNAFGIMLMGQLSARLVGRFGPARLLRVGLASSLTGAALLLGVGLAGGGLAGILPGFFLMVSSIGWIGPNATALALEDHAAEAGSASALLGLAQFVIGGVVAPLAGVAGPLAEMPMALVIAGASAAAVTSYAVLARRGEARRPAPVG
jgi:DHA1 family bicyclomycin/chloramphenicol resistance-like MFS transporter